MLVGKVKQGLIADDKAGVVFSSLPTLSALLTGIVCCVKYQRISVLQESYSYILPAFSEIVLPGLKSMDWTVWRMD